MWPSPFPPLRALRALFWLDFFGHLTILPFFPSQLPACFVCGPCGDAGGGLPLHGTPFARLSPPSWLTPSRGDWFLEFFSFLNLFPSLSTRWPPILGGHRQRHKCPPQDQQTTSRTRSQHKKANPHNDNNAKPFFFHFPARHPATLFALCFSPNPQVSSPLPILSVSRRRGKGRTQARPHTEEALPPARGTPRFVLPRLFSGPQHTSRSRRVCVRLLKKTQAPLEHNASSKRFYVSIIFPPSNFRPAPHPKHITLSSVLPHSPHCLDPCSPPGLCVCVLCRARPPPVWSRSPVFEISEKKTRGRRPPPSARCDTRHPEPPPPPPLSTALRPRLPDTTSPC